MIPLDYSEQMRVIHEGHPVLRFCEQFDETSDIWEFRLHTHPYLELMFFLEGHASIDADGSQMSAALFDTVLYPAGCPHREAPSPELHREIICLWVDLPELQLDQPLRVQDRGGRLDTLFRYLHACNQEANPPPYLMEHLLKVLLLQLLRMAASGGGPAELSGALQYIRLHCADRITLQELADLEHISVSYLARRFRRITGMTVTEYINHVRVERARYLLATTDKPVQEISYLVGYESPQYFYRVFRARCGETPSAFRRRTAHDPAAPRL